MWVRRKIGKMVKNDGIGSLSLVFRYFYIGGTNHQRASPLPPKLTIFLYLPLYRQRHRRTCSSSSRDNFAFISIIKLHRPTRQKNKFPEAQAHRPCPVTKSRDSGTMRATKVNSADSLAGVQGRVEAGERQKSRY
jgi:hypothetical protein